MIILEPSKKSLELVIKIVNQGGVVVFPTDTVYGFLADANNKKAVLKIFKIKKRLKSQTLPIFVKDLKMAKELAEISPEQIKILKSKWPGKFTFVLKARASSLRGAKATKQSQGLSKLVVKNGTVALRIPKYKFLNDLLKQINKPLVQTSVNISNSPPLLKIDDISSQFGKNKLVDLIIDGGNLLKGKQSVIMDLTGVDKKIIRK